MPGKSSSIPVSKTKIIVPPRRRELLSRTRLLEKSPALYFGGQLISNIGTWMQIIAQGWVVYQIGHSELALGLVAFASAIPVLLISPWAGVIVDRMSRRKLLMMTQSGAMILAFIMAALTFSNVIQEWHVIVLAALLGVVNAFDAPARQAADISIEGATRWHIDELDSTGYGGGRGSRRDRLREGRYSPRPCHAFFFRTLRDIA